MEFLPLGSVVEVEGAEDGQKAIIISRLPLMKHNGELGYFDYAGVAYPQGQDGDKSFFFNQENIKEVFFEGWKDSEEEKEYQELLNETAENIEYPKFSFDMF